MDNTCFIEYLILRRKVLLAELQIVSNALFGNERDEDISELESEVIMIMKSSGTWTKKRLAVILKERNPNLEIDNRTLMKNISNIFSHNPNIRSVKPWGWEFVQSKEAIG